MFERLLHKWRRVLAGILAVILTITGLQVPVFANTSYSNYLDGWKVEAAWSTLSTDYEWNAVADETRQPKIVVTYRMEHAKRDYPAGSLTFAIPGIGNAHRGSIVKADKLAADKEDSEWNYTWDQENDIYIFTNKFEVKEGQSVSGGFEFLWTLNARSCEDRFSQEKSPMFSVDGVGSIVMEPLSYSFTSERDRYRIYLSKSKLSAMEYEEADKNYVWYDLTTRFDNDRRARGLYRSSYFVSLELPEGVDSADVKVECNGKTVALSENEDGELGFYPFKEKMGDLSSQSFRLGFKQEVMEGKEVTVRGHLDRLYNDESEWVTVAGDNEIVDVETTFTVESYRFVHNGYIYSHTKENYSYESSSGNAPSNYSNRLNAVNLYNGKIVPFTLYGSARRQYAQGKVDAKASSRAATPSDAERETGSSEIPEGIEDWNDIHWNENGLVEEIDTVTFELDGGTIVPDGGTSAQTSLALQVKEGRSIEKPQNDPVKEGFIFKGWFTDKGCIVEANFPLTMGKTDKTIYAKWEQDAVKVKYAVSIYGIMQDVDDKGQTVGLTFGPATGASYVNTYKDHAPSAGQMCMHHMSWEEIIAQSQKDPNVFRECLKNSCTHSVELTITGKLAEGATSYPNMVGDGAGILYNSIANDYRRWNAYKDGDYSNEGGWPASRIRSTLNGRQPETTEVAWENTANGSYQVTEDKLCTEEDSLFSGFPAELKEAIVPKAVKSDTVYNDVSGNNMVTYDKLWLFSNIEYWGYGGNSFYDEKIRSNEGELYQKQKESSITTSNYSAAKLFIETGSAYWVWLRTISRGASALAGSVNANGNIGSNASCDGIGLAPGFCLPGPKPDVKYAVSLYGIKHDTYKDENGVTGTAGLTFGPATGKSYVNTFKAHTPTGNTASGNAHLCIHNDDWATIASWSQKDPYVYEQCIDGGGSGESCTKSVPIVLNEKLKGTSYPSMTGDGTGILRSSISSSYRAWNRKESTYFNTTSNEYKNGTNKGGWPDSAVRNTLNGTLTNNMLNITNKNNEFAEAKLNEGTALISCFPPELQDAIVPKTVKSDTVYNNVSGNNVITYDKLWLLSGSEIYIDSGSNNNIIRPNEGTTYERAKVLGITTSSYSKNRGYNEVESPYNRWLRSADRSYAYTMRGVNSSGSWYYSNVSSTYGLAPGFCLK